MTLYGIFIGPKWGMSWNKRNALRIARKNGGEVRAMPDPGSNHSWDAPTFRVCSRTIADFSK